VSAAEPPGRLIQFEAVENFRDFGGYDGARGPILRGRLFRSAHQGRASEGDVARLDGLNLAVVVDLRRPDERRRDPCRRPPAFGARVIETALEGGAEALYVKFLRETDLTTDNAHAFMMEEYARLPFEPAHLEVFGRYFQALAEAEGPVLIHCAAGKDRTGLLAALTHHLLGVSADDLMADYLLTNEARSLSAWAPRFAELIEREYGRRPPMDAVEAFLRVHPDWLRAAFASIEARAGGLDGYLEEALGVDRDLRERIAVRLSD
jgi:protein tyrosine/serine phosphatase